MGSSPVRVAYQLSDFRCEALTVTAFPETPQRVVGWERVRDRTFSSRLYEGAVESFLVDFS